MSSARPIGSAKASRVRKAGAGRRGSIGSAMRAQRLVEAGERLIAEAARQRPRGRG